jgi:hypothetical protein
MMRHDLTATRALGARDWTELTLEGHLEERREPTRMFAGALPMPRGAEVDSCQAGELLGSLANAQGFPTQKN